MIGWHVSRESERPSWQTGLYTGSSSSGLGSGKTSACMYPFAQQLLSWQADRAGRRASALVLEVKGDFCYKYDSMIANIVPCGPIVFRKACYYNVGVSWPCSQAPSCADSYRTVPLYIRRYVIHR